MVIEFVSSIQPSISSVVKVLSNVIVMMRFEYKTIFLCKNTDFFV